MEGESVNHDLGEKTTISTNYRIGDCIELMHELQDDSVDLVCTDPPYGYSFMV
jgi:DNA modification methylase